MKKQQQQKIAAYINELNHNSFVFPSLLFIQSFVISRLTDSVQTGLDFQALRF